MQIRAKIFKATRNHHSSTTGITPVLSPSGTPPPFISPSAGLLLSHSRPLSTVPNNNELFKSVSLKKKTPEDETEAEVAPVRLHTARLPPSTHPAKDRDWGLRALVSSPAPHKGEGSAFVLPLSSTQCRQPSSLQPLLSETSMHSLPYGGGAG